MAEGALFREEHTMDKKSITLKKANKLEAIKPFGLVTPRGFSPQGMPVAGGLK